jgi:predicted chitinase
MRSSDFIYESGWRKPISPADQARINKNKARPRNQIGPDVPERVPTNKRKAQRAIDHAIKTAKGPVDEGIFDIFKSSPALTKLRKKWSNDWKNLSATMDEYQAFWKLRNDIRDQLRARLPQYHSDTIIAKMANIEADKILRDSGWSGWELKTGKPTKTINEKEVSESAKKKIAAALLGVGLLGTPSKIDQQHPPLAKSLVSKAVSGLNKIEQGIKDAAEEAGITGHEVAQILAQTAQETGDFVHMRETGTRAYFLKKYWYNKDVRRRLGNKTPQDALDFIGRGFVHLTGRANYDRMSDILGIDLVNNPELAERPDVAMKILLRYFKDRVEPNVTDFTDTNAVTDQINKHDKPEARKNRENKYQKYKDILGL